MMTERTLKEEAYTYARVEDSISIVRHFRLTDDLSVDGFLIVNRRTPGTPRDRIDRPQEISHETPSELMVADCL